MDASDLLARPHSALALQQASLDPATILLDVEAQTDRGLDGQGSGSDKTCRVSKKPRLGPVGWIFQRYADGSFLAQQYGLDSTLEQHHRPVLAEEPVMRLEHAMLLMEDFLIVPQTLPRRDIRTAFRLAADAGHPTVAAASIKDSLPAGQPKRLHFSQFCDFLVRLALAVSAKQPRPAPTLRGDEVKPEDQIQQFLKQLGLTGPGMAQLQERVYLIFRQGDELRGHRKALLQWEYYFCKSGMDEAARRADLFGGWNPCESKPAPEALMKRITRRDLTFQLMRLPVWGSLPAPAFHLGSVQQGSHLACRLLLRNRGTQQLKITAHAKGCPCVILTYAQEPVCSGIPFIISMKVATDKPGQQQGVLEVTACPYAKFAPPSSRNLSIPFSVDVKEIVREPKAGRDILTQQQITEILTHHKHPIPRLPAAAKSQMLKIAV